MITNSSHLLNSAMAQTSREEEKNFKEKVAIYLKLISEATRMLNQNQGSLRRDVWAYLLKIYFLESCGHFVMIIYVSYQNQKLFLAVLKIRVPNRPNNFFDFQIVRSKIIFRESGISGSFLDVFS